MFAHPASEEQWATTEKYRRTERTAGLWLPSLAGLHLQGAQDMTWEILLASHSFGKTATTAIFSCNSRLTQIVPLMPAKTLLHPSLRFRWKESSGVGAVVDFCVRWHLDKWHFSYWNFFLIKNFNRSFPSWCHKCCETNSSRHQSKSDCFWVSEQAWNWIQTSTCRHTFSFLRAIAQWLSHSSQWPVHCLWASSVKLL